VTRTYNKGTAEQRFRARLLVVESGCWEWQGSLLKKGYGRFGFSSKEVVLAHRFAWELEHGAIPDGQCVLHRCDNPPCCNPAHLFLGTRADNNRDMWAKGRARIANRQGERANNAKLTEAQVIEIRRRYIPRVVTCKMLAADYGVTEHTIDAVVSRRNWAHVR